MRETREKNDGWQQTLRNGTTKGRSGKLVASCSRRWNSSAHSCEFCEQQQQRDRRVRWNCCPSVTNRCNRRHLTLPRSSIPSVTSGPGPSLSPHSYVACICRPSDRQTDRQRCCWEQPNGQLGRPAVVNCFNREKETHVPSCRRRHSAKPTHTDWQTDERTDGRAGGWSSRMIYTQLAPSTNRLKKLPKINFGVNNSYPVLRRRLLTA